MAPSTPDTVDITATANMSPELLRLFYDQQMSVSDTETTGLERERSAITQFASVRVEHVPEDPSHQPYRLKLLNRFILPMKPAYLDYLAAKARGENIPYDRSLYEYTITRDALEVTGTKFIRPDPAGPITGMEVDGKPVDAHPFYEIADEIAAFIRPHDLYYNAPFDKPMIAEKLRDVYAWRAVKDGADYHEESPEERAVLVDNVRARMTLPATMTNPSQWQCLMHAYLFSEGPGPSNTLEDAYRKLVDPAFGKRGDHSAIEDIVMAAKLAGALHAKLGELPTMAGIYERILKRADPEFKVTIGKERSSLSKTQNGHPVQGDIEIAFPALRESWNERTQKYWDFFAEYAEARRRNGRSWPYVITLDDKHHTVTLSAEERGQSKQALILYMLRNVTFYEKLLGSNLFESMTPEDFTGLMNVVVRGPGNKESRTAKDIPLVSLRKNLGYLRRHPDRILDNLAVIRTLHAHSDKVGMVVFEKGEPGHGDRVTIKGHLRAFGDVTFELPSGNQPADYVDKIITELDFMLKIGAIPEVQGTDAELEEGEDIAERDTDDNRAAKRDKNAPPIMKTRVNLNTPDRIQLTLAPRLMTMILRARGVIDIAQAEGKSWKPLKLGNVKISTKLGSDNKVESYVLEGSKLDFRDVLDLQRIEVDGASLVKNTSGASDKVTIEHHTDSAVDPVASVLRNASWLAYRLEHIPGTHASAMQDGHIILQLDDGISPEAIHVLRAAKIPCTIGLSAIEVDSDYLMKDAFHWSKSLGEAISALNRNMSKPVAKRDKIPQEEQALYRALLQKTVQRAHLDDVAQIWLTDNKTWADGRARYYKLRGGDTATVAADAAQGISLVASSLEGPFAHEQKQEGADIILFGQPAFMKALYLALGKPAGAYVHAESSFRHALRVPAASAAQLGELLPHMAELFHALSYTHGAKRQDMSDIDVADDGSFTLRAPLITVAKDASYLHDLSSLHQTMVQPELGSALANLRNYFPKAAEFDRRSTDLGALTDMLLQSEPYADLANASLQKLLSEIDERGFANRLPKELGATGMMLHEMEPTDEHIPQTHYVRNQLGVTHTSLLRLNEAAKMVERKIFSAHGNDNLRKVLADAVLYHVDSYLEKALASPHPAEAVGAYEKEMLRLLEHTASKLSEQGVVTREELEETQNNIHKKLRDAYAKKAQAYLVQLEERPEWETLTRALLQKAYPKYSDEQIDAKIEIYAHAHDMDWLQGAPSYFAEQHPDIKPAAIDGMIRECRFLTDPARKAEDRAEFERGIESEVDDAVASAYEHLAAQYMCLLKDHGEYAPIIRNLLERAHISREDIDRKLERAAVAKHGDASIQRAEILIHEPPKNNTLKELILHISPENEDTIRSLKREELRTRYEREVDRLGRLEPDPYDNLKLRRRIIKAAANIQEEIKDFQLIHFHAAQDVAASMALLQTDAVQRRTLEPDTKVVAPETLGLAGDTLPKVQQASEKLQDGWAQQAETFLKSRQVPKVQRSGAEIRFDGNALLQDPAFWTARLTGAAQVVQKTVATPLPISAAPTSIDTMTAGLTTLVRHIKELRTVDPEFDISVTFNIDPSRDYRLEQLLQTATQDPDIRVETTEGGRVLLHAPATKLAALLQQMSPSAEEANHLRILAKHHGKKKHFAGALSRLLKEEEDEPPQAARS